MVRPQLFSGNIGAVARAWGLPRHSCPKSAARSMPMNRPDGLPGAGISNVMLCVRPGLGSSGAAKRADVAERHGEQAFGVTDPCEVFFLLNCESCVDSCVQRVSEGCHAAQCLAVPATRLSKRRTDFSWTPGPVRTCVSVACSRAVSKRRQQNLLSGAEAPPAAAKEREPLRAAVARPAPTEASPRGREGVSDVQAGNQSVASPRDVPLGFLWVAWEHWALHSSSGKRCKRHTSRPPLRNVGG